MFDNSKSHTKVPFLTEVETVPLSVGKESWQVDVKYDPAHMSATKNFFVVMECGLWAALSINGFLLY